MRKYLHFNNGVVNGSKRQKKLQQSRTLAVDVVPKEKIQEIRKDFLNDGPWDPNTERYIRMNVGVSRLHELDRYNKKVGRELADKNLKETNVRIIGLTITQTHTFINLEKVAGVALNLRVNNATGFTTVTGILEFEG